MTKPYSKHLAFFIVLKNKTDCTVLYCIKFIDNYTVQCKQCKSCLIHITSTICSVLNNVITVLLNVA